MTTWKPLAGFGFRFGFIVTEAAALVGTCSRADTVELRTGCPAVTVEERTCPPTAAVAAVALDPTNKAAVNRAAARAQVDIIAIPQSP